MFRKVMLYTVLNVLMALAISFANVRAASADPIRDCCQCTTENLAFCCDNCCWITSDCTGSEGCAQSGCL